MEATVFISFDDGTDVRFKCDCSYNVTALSGNCADNIELFAEAISDYNVEHYECNACENKEVC